MQNYFGDAWNVFDFIVVLGSFIDIMMSEIDRKEEIDKGVKKDTMHVVAASNAKVYFSRSIRNFCLMKFNVLFIKITEHFDNIILPIVSCNAFGKITESR